MRERFSSVEQELSHKIWTIVQLFYKSHVVFRELFENYEQKVLHIAESTGISRHDLRLNSRELAGLLDLKRLERLRDGYIHDLKDLCHQVFRGQDQTDLLDRYVSDVFHEISILKEEHYNVQTYAPLYERDAAEVELRHILDEAHTMFPQKLQHIKYLFGRAQTRLEEHLPSFGRIALFVRSLFFHRLGFVKAAYPNGLDHFYRLMYKLGPVEGYYEVGCSFYLSGFFEQARVAFQLARHAAAALRLEPGVHERRRVHEMMRSIRSKLRALATKESLRSQDGDDDDDVGVSITGEEEKGGGAAEGAGARGAPAGATAPA